MLIDDRAHGRWRDPARIGRLRRYARYATLGHLDPANGLEDRSRQLTLARTIAGLPDSGRRPPEGVGRLDALAGGHERLAGQASRYKLPDDCGR
ncbi:hypothetical protein XM25_19855 [Devosia sp. H5989]|nr:hypothetical protein XM25_19855 [Devosia sp. H5989]